MAATKNCSPRERVLKAFAHEEADRVPLFEQGIASDVASALLGREAFTGGTMLHYQESCAWDQGEAAHDEFVERYRRDLIDVARVLELDMLTRSWRMSERPAKRLDDVTFLYGDPEGVHHIYRYDPVSKTYGRVKTVGEKTDLSPDDLEPIVEQAERDAEARRIDDPAAAFTEQHWLLTEYGDRYAVPGEGSIAIPIQIPWLMACALRPDLIARYLDAQLASTIKGFEAQKRMGVDLIWGGTDLADKNGPVYGPVVFREIVLPRIKRMTQACHDLGMLYLFRTDGNLWPIECEFFVESGIDGYGEIDHESGMRLEDLVPKHGDRLTFWGNVPCGSVLCRGTEQEVRDFVMRLIDVAAPGGGYLFGSANIIMATTPVRNVIAMYETAREYGVY